MTPAVCQGEASISPFGMTLVQEGVLLAGQRYHAGSLILKKRTLYSENKKRSKIRDSRSEIRDQRSERKTRDARGRCDRDAGGSCPGDGGGAAVPRRRDRDVGFSPISGLVHFL